MTDDRIAGTTRNLAGKAQSGFGRVTGDTKSQVEGQMNQAAGAAQDLYGQAKENVEAASEAAAEQLSTLEDTIRDAIENRPYTAVAVAFALGWIVSRMGRSA